MSSIYKGQLSQWKHIQETVKATDNNLCWFWEKSKNKKGYGQTKYQGKSWLVHRLAYYFFFGNLNSFLEIDHLCNNTSCWNPRHLEEVSLQENALRKKMKNVRCKQGHELTLENTYQYSNGGRACRICKKEYSWKFYHDAV